MSVVISGSLVLSGEASGGGIVDANNPLIGWQNLVNESNISATTEAEDFPATNMANPSTNLRWEGDPSSPAVDDYITIVLNTVEPIDYVGIARHNFGSAQIPISIEVQDIGGSPEWVEVISETLLATDAPVLFRFAPQGVTTLRIRLQPGTATPTAAVIYAGPLLVLQRRIYVGHTPVTMGRVRNISSVQSEGGQFLGRLVISQMTKTGISLMNLTPGWYREYLDPFIEASAEIPFFWAWRPGDYPDEVGYVWVAGDPKPANQLSNGMMNINIDVTGIYR